MTSPGLPESSATPASTTSDADGVLAEQLLRLTRRLNRIQKRGLEPLGITPAQSRLLRVVAHSDTPPRMADVARRLEVVPRAVTTLVDALEEGGLVRRVADPDSRRVTRIEVTENGREALRSMRSARRGAAEDILSPLTATQRAQFGALLATLVGGAPEYYGHHPHGPELEYGGHAPRSKQEAPAHSGADPVEDSERRK
ncbi:MarR family transcriptional regulator [Streptomyces tsukubensis]|nr:MarR family transcriptional regulator [Streptomyces tsukubensis]QFR96970.1 MarR family transcriptional regulator [Streptomyces tsukubensis]